MRPPLTPAEFALLPPELPGGLVRLARGTTPAICAVCFLRSDVQPAKGLLAAGADTDVLVCARHADPDLLTPLRVAVRALWEAGVWQ